MNDCPRIFSSIRRSQQPRRALKIHHTRCQNMKYPRQWMEVMQFWCRASLANHDAATHTKQTPRERETARHENKDRSLTGPLIFDLSEQHLIKSTQTILVHVYRRARLISVQLGYEAKCLGGIIPPDSSHSSLWKLLPSAMLGLLANTLIRAYDVSIDSVRSPKRGHNYTYTLT